MLCFLCISLLPDLFISAALVLVFLPWHCFAVFLQILPYHYRFQSHFHCRIYPSVLGSWVFLMQFMYDLSKLRCRIQEACKDTREKDGSVLKNNFNTLCSTISVAAFAVLFVVNFQALLTFHILFSCVPLSHKSFAFRWIWFPLLWPFLAHFLSKLFLSVSFCS